MITVHIMGNIGNQLFIYAMARSIQLEKKQQLTFDLSGLKRNYYKANYKLDCFAIPTEINYDLRQLGLFSRCFYKLSSSIYHLQHFYYRKKNGYTSTPESLCRRWYKRGCIYNTRRSYLDEPFPDKKNLYVYGYFQSEKYFKKYEDIIRQELKVITPISSYSASMIEQMASCNSVAVSIRASVAPENPKVKDNLELGFIDKDYYYRGMEEIAKHVENPVFYIFADNLDIVKAEYDFPYPVVYVTPEDSADGIRLMYNCKHFVIANSTFSWWGAYLSSNPDKKVVVPAVFDRVGPRPDIFGEDVIKLDVQFLNY